MPRSALCGSVCACARHCNFVEQVANWGNIVVAFDHHRHRPSARHHSLKKVPDVIANRLIVRVDQQVLTLTMTGDMDLTDMVHREAGDIPRWIEAKIMGADIDIVDVKQQATASVRAQLGEKFPLGHF